ncbi:hypothetical protein EMIT079MI2_80099 [Bacillus sp. IT-79MI2]
MLIANMYSQIISKPIKMLMVQADLLKLFLFQYKMEIQL